VLQVRFGIAQRCGAGGPRATIGYCCGCSYFSSKDSSLVDDEVTYRISGSKFSTSHASDCFSVKTQTAFVPSEVMAVQ